VKSSTVISALLGATNDGTTVHEYGDGFLVDLPLTYSDGDSVRLLIEPVGGGYRVSDQASAQERLLMADVTTEHGRVAEAIAATIRAAGLVNIGGEADELAVFGSAEDLGRSIWAVGSAAMRIEQLRWLAVRRPPVKFAERVVERVTNAAREGWKVRKNAPIRLTSGRERPVTVAVTQGTTAAYVQALSSSDFEKAAEHCHYLFSFAEDRHTGRVAALAGEPGSWPSAIVKELGSIADIEYFGRPGSLESAVERALAGTAQTSL
jgi:hypothetical protein